MRLLDTNIFVYAHGRPHPYAEPCRLLLSQMLQENLEYTVDTELLQEIMHLYSARGQLGLGLALFDDIVTIFPDPLAIGIDVMIEARRLLGEYSVLSPRDAIHAAVVIQQDLEGLVSTDRGFDEVIGLRRYDPMDLDSAN